MSVVRRVAPIGAMLVSACFPTIVHGPRVENGFAFGVTAASTSGDTHTEGDEGGIHLRDGAIGAFIGQGWAPSNPRSPGAYVGVVVPVFFPYSQLDLYIQAPTAWTGALSAGLGAMGSIEGGSVYTQVGIQPESGVGWQAMAGYGVRASSSRFQGTSPAWIGNLGVSFASGHFRGLLFVQGARGREPESCFTDPSTQRQQCELGDRARAISFGVSLARHQRNAGPPP